MKRRVNKYVIEGWDEVRVMGMGTDVVGMRFRFYSDWVLFYCKVFLQS